MTLSSYFLTSLGWATMKKCKNTVEKQLNLEVGREGL